MRLRRQDCFFRFSRPRFPVDCTRDLSGENLMAELWAKSACELAELVRAREVSAREVIEAHLDRIGQVNPALNAVTVVLAADALRAAGETDAALRRDGVAPPLCGVPMTVKENIDVAGSATTLGIAALRDAVAERDSPHIGELRAAGAIPVGRANMPEFGMRWHTASALRGATRNPWSAGHTPGGSSGGDAAAVCLPAARRARTDRAARGGPAAGVQAHVRPGGRRPVVRTRVAGWPRRRLADTRAGRGRSRRPGRPGRPGGGRRGLAGRGLPRRRGLPR